MARIEIDGVSISPAGVVLYPGQVVDLERFIDSPQKFKFVTYTVPEKNGDAIRDNGKVRVEFYNQYVPLPYSPPATPILTIPYPNYPQPDVWYISESSTDGNFTVSYSVDKELHTGKTVPGSHSSQDFVNVDMQFNSWPAFTTELLIKPLSEMVKLSKKETAVYCPTCGRRFRRKERFCPQCGTKR